jgi:hypothetical protein
MAGAEGGAKAHGSALLSEAARALTRVELLLEIAAREMAEPHRIPLESIAVDCARLRERIRVVGQGGT